MIQRVIPTPILARRLFQHQRGDTESRVINFNLLFTLNLFLLQFLIILPSHSISFAKMQILIFALILGTACGCNLEWGCQHCITSGCIYATQFDSDNICLSKSKLKQFQIQRVVRSTSQCQSELLMTYIHTIIIIFIF